MWRYAVLYFVMFVVFLALVVGPTVGGSKISGIVKPSSLPFNLMQPTGQNNNDTGANATTTSASATASGTSGAKLVKLF